MKTKILKVIAQTEPVYVQSKKNKNNVIPKCSICLRELGSDYEDEYQCTLLGDLALCRFEPDDIVFASLRFTTHEINGVWYQKIVVKEIVKIA